MAGSFAVEQMTDALESMALEYIDKIDELGGMVAAVEAGYVQREIQDAAYQAQLDIENKTLFIVGMNAFKEDETVSPPVLKIDPQLERDQVERLRAFPVRSVHPRHSPNINVG